MEEVSVSAASLKIIIENAFRDFDRDGSGFLDAQEISLLAEELGHPLTDEELKEALESLDTNQDHQISIDEFVVWWIAKGNGANKKLLQIAKEGRIRHYTDIFIASWNGDLSQIERFIQYQPDLVNEKDNSEFGGCTCHNKTLPSMSQISALHCRESEMDRKMAEESNTTRIKVIPPKCRCNAYTPLHYAAYQGHVDVVRFLLEHGANPNLRNEEGCTPLFLAVQQSQVDVVKVLIEFNADATISDFNYGFIPLDVVSPGDEATAQQILQLIVEKYDFQAPQPVHAPQTHIYKKNAIIVSWECPEPTFQKVLPIKSYQIRAIDVTNPENKIVQVVKTVKADSQRTIIPKLAPNHEYRFQVRVVNSLGASSWSRASAPLLLQMQDSEDFDEANQKDQYDHMEGNELNKEEVNDGQSESADMER